MCPAEDPLSVMLSLTASLGFQVCPYVSADTEQHALRNATQCSSLAVLLADPPPLATGWGHAGAAWLPRCLQEPPAQNTGLQPSIAPSLCKLRLVHDCGKYIWVPKWIHCRSMLVPCLLASENALDLPSCVSGTLALTGSRAHWLMGVKPLQSRAQQQRRGCPWLCNIRMLPLSSTSMPVTLMGDLALPPHQVSRHGLTCCSYLPGCSPSALVAAQRICVGSQRAR